MLKPAQTDDEPEGRQDCRCQAQIPESSIHELRKIGYSNKRKKIDVPPTGVEVMTVRNCGKEPLEACMLCYVSNMTLHHCKSTRSRMGCTPWT